MTEIQKGKILLIDDDENAGRVILETLGARGVEVVIVTDPEKAIEKALEIEPDIVFVNFVLPGQNGLKVSRAIHSSEKLKDVPVFLMMPEELEKEYGDYFGVVNVFTKPLNTDKLVLKTLKVLEEKASPPEESPRVRAFSIVSRQEYETLEKEMEKLLGEKDQGELEFEEEKTIAAPEVSAVSTGETGVQQEKEHQHEELNTMRRSSERRIYDETGKDGSIKRYYIYASAVIIAIVGAVAFYIISNRHVPETLTQQPVEESVVIEEKKAPELIILDDRKGVDEIPSGIAEKKELPVDIPVAEKAPAKKTEASGKTVYAVQAGAFLDGANAASLSDRLRKKGYDAYIKKVVRPDKKTVHRVLIGKFESEKKAVEHSELIRKKEGIKSFVYHYSS